MASIVVVPVLLGLFQWLKLMAPWALYMMAGIAALYIPALALVRRPTVTLTKDYRVTVHAPKTVDTRILANALASAVAYFLILIFVIFMTEGRI